MTEEKNLDESKKENRPQEKADERLTDDELDKVAGGTGEPIYLKETLPDDTTYETMGK